MTVPTKTPPAGDIMESVIIKGDLSKLTPEERVRYYNEICRSLGLNPLTKPFEYIILNGKLQLYALRAATDQLRKINKISVKIISQDMAEGLFNVHVHARADDGREDEDLGVVNFPDTLRGEARANSIMKGVTKAKRRVTLSICGLGWLDETEVEDIPVSAKRPPPPAPNVLLQEPDHDPETGEILTAAPTAPGAADAAPGFDASPSSPGAAPPVSDMLMNEADEYLAKAAAKGMDALRAAWSELSNLQQQALKAALERRHKPTALAAKKE